MGFHSNDELKWYMYYIGWKSLPCATGIEVDQWCFLGSHNFHLILDWLDPLNGQENDPTLQFDRVMWGYQECFRMGKGWKARHASLQLGIKIKSWPTASARLSANTHIFRDTDKYLRMVMVIFASNLIVIIQTDRQTDGQTNGWTDGWIDATKYIISRLYAMFRGW